MKEAAHFALVASLKACGKEKNIHKGFKLHSDVIKRGLYDDDDDDKSSYAASAVISMYSKCGLLCEARDTLRELRFPSTVSWNALISGFAQMGRWEQALESFERMRSESVPPNAVTFASVLKACGAIADIERGKLVHGIIVIAAGGDEGDDGSWLGKDAVLGVALVDMYVKCGSIPDARRAHDDLSARNAVSWSILIAGYANAGQAHQALESYEQMRIEGIYAESGPFFICILKACGSIADPDKGKQVHREILRSEGLLEKDTALCNALVDMYARCGALPRAREILHEIRAPTVVSWNALIGGYAREGRSDEAFDCFERMRIEGTTPDAVTMLCVLKACRWAGKGRAIHQEIVWRRSIEEEEGEEGIALGNALVDMYARCGLLSEARNVIDQLPFRDMFAWNALIAGYCKQGQGQEALICFERLQSEEGLLLHPDEATFTCILKACGMVGAIDEGKRIHGEIVGKGLLLEENDRIGAALVDMYVKCGDLATAEQVLEGLPMRNVVSWCSLVSGYIDRGEDRKALDMFESMRNEGLCPDVVSFTPLLKACGRIGAVGRGERIHREIVSKGWLSQDRVIGNAVIDMYAKCGELRKAHDVLEEIRIRDLVAWNSLIGGYVRDGQARGAVGCFELMSCEGIRPNVVTFICILQACGELGAAEEGKLIHSEIVERRLLEQDIVLANALLQMYVECGMLSNAERLFEALRGSRDIASWNAMLAAFARDSEHGLEALERFECLQKSSRSRLCADSITLSCILKACGSIGAAEKGMRIHGEIASRGFLDKDDNTIGNALIDMYAKCGMLANAAAVMAGLPIRDRACWNAMIGGYAQQGRGREALECYREMQQQGKISPDEITFLALLSAFNHSGLINEARILYQNTMETRDLVPHAAELCTCMATVLGYAGRFEQAMSIIRSTSSRCYIMAWLAVLGACQKWGNVELGKLAFDRAIELDRSCAPAYALMAQVLASAHMQSNEDRSKQRMQRDKEIVSGSRKNIGAESHRN